MATYGPMHMESATVGWVAASDGIYRLDNGVLTKRYTNTNNWTITGIAVLSNSIIISTSNFRNLYTCLVASVSITDVSGFTEMVSGAANPLIGLVVVQNTMYYMDSIKAFYSKTFSGSGTQLTGHGLPVNTQISMVGLPGTGDATIYVSTRVNVLRYDIVSTSVTTSVLSILTPGRIAADSAGNIFFASSGVKEYNASFLINSVNQCNQLSYSPISTIAFFGNDGRAIDASGAVYSMTSSATALATGLPAPLTVDITTMNTITDITTAITPSFPNLVLPRWSNMIVPGAESASISKLASATISRAEFDAILLRRYGSTTVTDAIRANCQFLPDTTVVVPIRR